MPALVLSLVSAGVLICPQIFVAYSTECPMFFHLSVLLFVQLQPLDSLDFRMHEELKISLIIVLSLRMINGVKLCNLMHLSSRREDSSV